MCGGDLETEYNCVDQEEGLFSIYRYSIELPRRYSLPNGPKKKRNSMLDSVSPLIRATPHEIPKCVLPNKEEISE